MGRGFYIVMAAQFFSALADNALLIAAISVLINLQAPAEQVPLLKFFFTVSYVALAAFVGAFADSMPKWRVMLISNSIKIFGCALMFLDLHPLAAYAVVGLGAAAYSPAKYGILTEMLPASKLVVANGWIEGLTVGAIILGTLLGGILIRPELTQWAFGHGLPSFGPIFDSPTDISILLIGGLYLLAAIFNYYVPDTGVDHKPLKNNPIFLIREFGHCVALLWRDKLGQISLAVTTLFWGAGATLQFIVLDWAFANLDMKLSQATNMQGGVAFGVAVGSVLAAKFISLRQSASVIPLGIAMGLCMLIMVFIHSPVVAGVLMVSVGALAGFFVVPMNALLQHRGHVLMGAGHSIAVQNFNENLSILVMTGLYAVLVKSGLPVNIVIVIFGLFMAGSMLLIKRWHEANQREFDSVALLDSKHHH
ncbi:lysophospholipid transporter LplT [Uliginosibacterium sp. 31-16]|uniref:lysophospholipid transporter LplT n=1 Tax=Uliginosibacterium sp. 31-16 TaxID=3068315 RepID=UPI00273FC49B|nr:lysophospholipid transporter LplT [Uliginosibacterium sp. 31-16]MDP5239551.1 lysophospholipid transporter LplT [Uliginosibacterium sp. 31-16]